MNGYPTKQSCSLGLTNMFMSLFALFQRDSIILPLQDSRIPRHKMTTTKIGSLPALWSFFWRSIFCPKKKDFVANLSKGFAWYIFQNVVKRSHPQTHLAIAPPPQCFTTSPRNFYGFQLSVQSPSSYSMEDEVCRLLFFRRR